MRRVNCSILDYEAIWRNWRLFSSPTQFAKSSNKKVITENQCEKHKKLEFFFSYRKLASSWETSNLERLTMLSYRG